MVSIQLELDDVQPLLVPSFPGSGTEETMKIGTESRPRQSRAAGDLNDDSSDGAPMDAFTYAGGTMTDLNSLVDPSSGWDLQFAVGINDAGKSLATE
jgi:hypothetical protein